MKKRKIVFSIIIPIFNTPKELLVSCFESIENQDCKSFEVIIVDDGSNEICKKNIEDLSLKFEAVTVIHKINEGVSKARNIGIEKASGEYILFVDSDNTLPRNALRIYEELIDTKPDLIIGLSVLGKRKIENGKDIIVINDNNIQNVSLSDYETVDDKVELVDHLLTGRVKKYNYKYGYFADGPCGKLFLAEIVKQIKYPEHLKWDEDTIWLLNFISQSKKILVTPRIVYFAIEYELSATRRFRPGCIGEFYDVCIAEKEIEKKFSYNLSAFAYKRFSNILLVSRLYFFHKDNSKSDSIRFREFMNLCTNKQTNEVFNDVLKYITEKNSHAMVFRMFSIAFKLKLYRLCWVLLGMYCKRR